MVVFHAFYLAFAILFSTLLPKTNEYTFRKSSKIFFALANTEMSMNELKERGNRLFLENTEKLSVVCQLVDKNNWNLLRSKELTGRHASTGLQPYITFKNKTWWKTYKFPSRENISNVHWRLEISRDEFLQGSNDVLFEPWFVTMELGYGLGLFETTGILIQKEPLLNLSQSLGSQVDASLVVKSSDQFVVKPAPCCNDISFILPFKNKENSLVDGCYIGITFGALTPQTVLWLNICSKQDSNRSLCHIFPQMDCNKLRLLDLVVTRNYLIIATSFGLVRSASFRHLVSGKYLECENYLVISQSDNPFDNSLSSGAGDMQLHYTSYCVDFHVFDDKKDFFYVLFKNSVYKSVSPFTRLLEMPVSNLPLSGLRVLGIINDLTKNTHVLLAQSLHNKITRHIVLAVTHDTSIDMIFPPWYFPEDAVATDLHCHTWSSSLFVYGSQVWQSRDGGNSFHQLTELTLNHPITSLSLPQYDNSIVAMTDNGAILHGRVDLPRLVAIHRQPFLGTLQTVLMDELQNIVGFFRNESSITNLFGDYLVRIVPFESYQNHFCGSHVLLQFVSKEEVLFFVPAPFSDTNETLRKYCVGRDAVGQVFRSRLGGSAHITEVTYLNSSLGYLTSARGKVIELFAAVSSSLNPILESSIRLNLAHSGSYEVTIDVAVGHTGWSSNDEGKTVVLSNGMSILLKSYINETTMYGLPPVGISADLLPQGTQEKHTWQLYDLRSGTVFAQSKDALLLSRSSEGFEATTAFQFSPTHVGMVLMISSDNFGVIKTVKDLGRVLLQNNTILKEGNYSGWSLYRPAMNTTELMSVKQVETGPGMWWIEEEGCTSFPIVTPRQYKILYHMDSRDNLSLEFTVLTKHPEGDDPQITMFVGNPSLFRIQSTHLYSDTNYTLKVDLQKKSDTSGLSLISFNTRDKSLNCPRISSIHTIHGGCPPSKRLVFEYPHTFPPEVFLHGSPKDNIGELRSHKLPPNYRPPSSRGIGIPMSSNIYNVYPEKPPYKGKFAISRKTRLYKQCRGKSSRQECECKDDTLGMSSLVALSDCINTVYRLIFGETFKPKFTTVQDDAADKPFHDPYYVVELNLRSDYQVLRGITLTDSGGEIKTVLQDNLNSSLTFSGSGLYHFRAYGVKEGYTLCNLNDEFIVFVDDMPLPHPVREILRVTTAMVFAGICFLTFLWFFYLTKKGEVNRVFRDG